DVSLVDLRESRAVWKRSAAGPPLEFPSEERDLEREVGYRVSVEASAPRAGAASGWGVFDVVSADRAADYARPVGAIPALDQDGAAGLATAFLALRLGFGLEAEREARAYLESHPGDPIASEALEIAGSSRDAVFQGRSEPRKEHR